MLQFKAVTLSFNYFLIIKENLKIIFTFQQSLCLHPLSSAYSASLPVTYWLSCPFCCACRCVPILLSCTRPSDIPGNLSSMFTTWETVAVNFLVLRKGRIKLRQTRSPSVRAVRSCKRPPWSALPASKSFVAQGLVELPVFSVCSAPNSALSLEFVQSPLEPALVAWLPSHVRSSTAWLFSVWRRSSPALPWNFS